MAGKPKKDEPMTLPLPRPVFDANASGGGFGELPDWDLSDLYAGADAPEFAADMGWLEKACAGFAAAYEGKLAGLDAAGLLVAVQAYEEIEITAGRIMSFAGLRYYQNTMDSGRAKFMSDAEGRVTDFTTPLVFWSLEFNRLEDAHLARLLAGCGADVTDLGICADEPEHLLRRLTEAAPGHDLIVSTGGASVGLADHMSGLVARRGAVEFWRLQMRPGKPVGFGDIDDCPVLVLPGNPVAVFVTFAHVVRPFLAVLGGGEAAPLLALPVRAAFAYAKKAGRREYVRVALRRAADGVIEAVNHPREGAGVITSLTETDGLLELPEAVERIAPGDQAGFLSYALLR